MKNKTYRKLYMNLSWEMRNYFNLNLYMRDLFLSKIICIGFLIQDLEINYIATLFKQTRESFYK